MGRSDRPDDDDRDPRDEHDDFRRRHRRHHHHDRPPNLHDHLHQHLHEHFRHHGPFQHLRRPQGLRHYFGAHLHRRLFMWFGLSIFVTGSIFVFLSHRLEGTGGRRPLTLLLVVGVVLWALTGKIARRIAQPLYELVRVAKEIGAGRLKARAQPHWRIDEISILAVAINDMAERIERQIADQRELLAGVSHEIRTPLARIRVLLELARAGSTPDTLDELEREVMEIDALVGELLASARLDFAALAVRPLDSGAVARQALERAGVVATALSVETQAVEFAGDPTLMARALANLIDNARKHGGGVQRLRVRSAPGLVLFDVEDGGPGFPAPGETKERPVGSLGLGLVLVRRIADAHRGALQLTNRPEGGARATLVVSVDPPATGETR